MSSTNYTFGKNLNTDFDQAIDLVKQALSEEGFGVLTEIDVAATMKKKLDLDMKPYRILGACNPNFAHQAIEVNPSIGSLLPCNVVVRKNEDDSVYVEFMDPESVLGIVNDPVITKVGTEVKAKLVRVMDAL
jgi:uncharacterized protein (DUF302 family)